MSEVKTKEDMLSELQTKFNNNSFEPKHHDIASNKESNIASEDFDLVQNKHSKKEVNDKVHKAMMRNMDKLRNLPNIDFSQIPSEFYDGLGKKVDFSDLDPNTPPPNTLPATISKELKSAGTIDIKWSDTRDLPRGGDLHIRALANAVFSSFDIDKNANVVCVNSFPDKDFLNKPHEINAIIGHLEKYASKPHEGVMIQDFGKTIENYKPEIKLYHTPSTAYLCVSEPEGQGLEARYIYAFKRKQEKKLQNTKEEKLENKSNNRLKNR